MARRSEPLGSRAAGALTGALHVVLVFVGSALIARTIGAGRHSLDVPSGDVAAYLADADHTRVWIGEYVGALGFLLFLPFSAYVVESLRSREANALAWWPGTARAAATLYVGLSLAGLAALVPALNREGEAAAGFLDLRTTLIGLAFMALAVWLVTVGLQALRGRWLPAWLGWAAVVIGVLELLATPLAAYDPGFTGVPTFAGFLWVAVVSVLLALRSRRDAAVAG